MRVLKLCLVGLATIIITVLSVSELGNASRWAKNPEQSAGVVSGIKTSHRMVSSSAGVATQRYRLDPSQSKFIAHAQAGGLLWFKGHDHLVAVREFTGEAQSPRTPLPPLQRKSSGKPDRRWEQNGASMNQKSQLSKRN